MAKHAIRQDICDWLTALGVDPNAVPIDTDMAIRPDGDGGRALHYEAFVTNTEGRKVINQQGTDCLVERRSVPLTVEPPEHWQPYEKPTREQLQQQLDAAYRERAHLVAWLAALHPSVIAPAPDVDEPDWQIVYIKAGGWQMTWHVHPRDAELFEDVESLPADDPRAQWDGHSTEQKYARMRQHVRVIHMNERLGKTACPVCEGSARCIACSSAGPVAASREEQL